MWRFASGAHLGSRHSPCPRARPISSSAHPGSRKKGGTLRWGCVDVGVLKQRARLSGAEKCRSEATRLTLLQERQLHELRRIIHRAEPDARKLHLRAGGVCSERSGCQRGGKNCAATATPRLPMGGCEVAGRPTDSNAAPCRHTALQEITDEFIPLPRQRGKLL